MRFWAAHSKGTMSYRRRGKTSICLYKKTNLHPPPLGSPQPPRPSDPHSHAPSLGPQAPIRPPLLRPQSPMD